MKIGLFLTLRTQAMADGADENPDDCVSVRDGLTGLPVLGLEISSGSKIAGRVRRRAGSVRTNSFHPALASGQHQSVERSEQGAIE